jgi:hypothetical protein
MNALSFHIISQFRTERGVTKTFPKRSTPPEVLIVLFIAPHQKNNNHPQKSTGSVESKSAKAQSFVVYIHLIHFPGLTEQSSQIYGYVLVFMKYISGIPTQNRSDVLLRTVENKPSCLRAMSISPRKMAKWQPYATA